MGFQIVITWYQNLKNTKTKVNPRFSDWIDGPFEEIRGTRKPSAGTASAGTIWEACLHLFNKPWDVMEDGTHGFTSDVCCTTENRIDWVSPFEIEAFVPIMHSCLPRVTLSQINRHGLENAYRGFLARRWYHLTYLSLSLLFIVTRLTDRFSCSCGAHSRSAANWIAWVAVRQALWSRSALQVLAGHGAALYKSECRPHAGRWRSRYLIVSSEEKSRSRIEYSIRRYMPRIVGNKGRKFVI